MPRRSCWPASMGDSPVRATQQCGEGSAPPSVPWGQEPSPSFCSCSQRVMDRSDPRVLHLDKWAAGAGRVLAPPGSRMTSHMRMRAHTYTIGHADRPVFPRKQTPSRFPGSTTWSMSSGAQNRPCLEVRGTGPASQGACHSGTGLCSTT